MDKEPPKDLVPLNTTSALSAAQSTPSLQQLERLKAANEAANKVFAACQDFDKSTPELLAVVTEYLARLEPLMLARVTGVGEGILLKTKFLPTVADFHGLVQELVAKDNQFKPAHTVYKKLEPERELKDGKTVEERKAFIAGLNLHEQFPGGQYLRTAPQRVHWDDEINGAPTEEKIKPEGSKFETPKEFPAHLWNTQFIQNGGC